MKKPTDIENIQLIAVLHVLGLSHDAIANALHIRNQAVGDTKKWIENEKIQVVWDIFEDSILNNTVGRELPSLEEIDNDTLFRASKVNRAAILAHYGREIPEDNLDEKLRQHRNDLADAANDVLKILSNFEGRTDLDENIGIGDVILEEHDTETRGILERPIVIGLFDHIKNDIAELAPLSCWQDLTPKYISFDLRKKISMKAATRNFSGVCEVCKVWMPI